MASPERSEVGTRGAADPDLESWVDSILAANAPAIARALDLVEDARPETRTRQRALLSALEPRAPQAHTLVGLTGPPGAGKSTLAGALLQHWLDRGQAVGMVAVDPSSRRSGGALLGDRHRLRLKGSAFVRSMAARGQLGGLAPATRGVTRVLRAAFAWSLIETVGVGQSEVQIASVADLVVLVLQPGSGDTLQFMKAGVLEIPDVFVVHKWDLGREAERTQSELARILALAPRRAGETPPEILGVSAQTGHGVQELAEHVEALRASLERTGALARRRAEADAAWGLELFIERYGTYGLDRIGGTAAARQLLLETPGHGLDRFAALTQRAGL